MEIRDKLLVLSTTLRRFLDSSFTQKILVSYMSLKFISVVYFSIKQSFKAVGISISAAALKFVVVVRS